MSCSFPISWYSRTPTRSHETETPYSSSSFTTANKHRRQEWQWCLTFYMLHLKFRNKIKQRLVRRHTPVFCFIFLTLFTRFNLWILLYILACCVCIVFTSTDKRMVLIWRSRRDIFCWNKIKKTGCSVYLWCSWGFEAFGILTFLICFFTAIN